jgi:hypothetical protein
MRTLKQEVEYVLENYPLTRNSDIDLTIRIWETYHQDKFAKILKTNQDKSAFEKMRLVMMELPREDNVKRIRAKFQNEMKVYLPTSEEVAKKRGFKVEEWRELLGYKQKSLW